MNEYAEEEWGDPVDKILKKLKDGETVTGWMPDNGGFWEISLYTEGDEPKGRDLVEIKGVKVWYELRVMLPSLPVMPLFPPNGGL